MGKNQHTPKENSLKKFLQGMSVHQKLGITLENNFNKNWSPKFGWFLTLKIDFESTILALFDEP